MILYFSGTGNSEYVARLIASKTNEEIISLNTKIKDNDFFLNVDERIVLVTPTYGWRIPRIVNDWLNKTPIKENTKIYFVMTCGGEIGGASKYNIELCNNKHLQYMGTTQILMPENYIAMFNAPDWDEAQKIIIKAKDSINNAIDCILNDKQFSIPRNNLYDRLMSDIVNPFFYTFCVKADKFYVKDTCIGCKECEGLCPLNNIRIKDNKPIWGKNCTHCMACICHCPTEAIEYGNISKAKPRYVCKMKVDTND